MNDRIKTITVTAYQIFVRYEGIKTDSVLCKGNHYVKVTGDGVIVISVDKEQKPILMVSVHRIDYIEFND